MERSYRQAKFRNLGKKRRLRQQYTKKNMFFLYEAETIYILQNCISFLYSALLNHFISIFSAKYNDYIKVYDSLKI